MNLSATIYDDTLTANQAFPRMLGGAMFKLISSTGPINIKTDKVNLKGITAGQGFEGIPYNSIEITDASGASNTIRYMVASDGFIDGLTGAMTVTSQVPPQSSSFANTQKTVTSASTQMVAANTARKYLMFQNNDTVGNIFIGFGAGAVTTANGVKIAPGGAYEIPYAQTQQAIQAIGSLATQSNVVMVEG